MNFKEALAHDAATVFLNTDEFAECMVVNGMTIPAMWGEESRPAPAVYADSIEAWGVNTESAVLLIPENVMELPVPQQLLTVDGREWEVIKARPQNGIIRIELQRNAA